MRIFTDVESFDCRREHFPLSTSQRGRRRSIPITTNVCPTLIFVFISYVHFLSAAHQKSYSCRRGPVQVIRQFQVGNENKNDKCENNNDASITYNQFEKGSSTPAALSSPANVPFCFDDEQLTINAHQQHPRPNEEANAESSVSGDRALSDSPNSSYAMMCCSMPTTMRASIAECNFHEEWKAWKTTVESKQDELMNSLNNSSKKTHDKLDLILAAMLAMTGETKTTTIALKNNNEKARDTDAANNDDNEMLGIASLLPTAGGLVYTTYN
jgi:hypothetical protein